jgi:hypothetical protein
VSALMEKKLEELTVKGDWHNSLKVLRLKFFAN